MLRFSINVYEFRVARAVHKRRQQLRKKINNWIHIKSIGCDDIVAKHYKSARLDEERGVEWRMGEKEKEARFKIYL